MPFETSAALLVMGQAVSSVGLPPPPPPPPGAEGAALVTVEPEPEADDPNRKLSDAGRPPPIPTPPEIALPSRHGRGFFFRESVGVGFAAITSRTSASEHDVPISAGTLNHELLIGGSPARGLNVGARFALAVAPAPGARDEASSDPLTISMGSAFLDIYPLPEEGLHIFGAAGLAIVNNARALGASEFAGFAWSLGLGYEFWVSPQWSMGFSVRVDEARTEASYSEDGYDDGATLQALMPGLQLSISYSSGS